MFIQPSPGLKIRDPDLKDHLPESGRNVPDTDYWRRRKNDGDVVDAVEIVAQADVPMRALAVPKIIDRSEKE